MESDVESGGVRRCRRHLEGLLGIPATEHNRVEALRNGDEIFPSMLEAIRGARHTIDFLTFVYWTGDIAIEMAGALADRARAGVRVRVLLDAFGTRLMDRGLIERMEDAGADVRRFRAPTNFERVKDSDHRTHRKVLVCDERVAFTGGVGIAEEWEGDARDETEWRDTHFRIQGPAVDGLRAAFVDDWVETQPFELFDEHDRFPDHDDAGTSTVQVVRGQAEVGWSDITTLKRALVRLARKRLRITTAYFSPDEHMCDLLAQAVARGVEVDVLIPGKHADKRVAQLAGEKSYEELLNAGVRIWNYQRTMLHAKILTIDGHVADVGSSNFNSRSFAHDSELDCVVFDPAFVATLDAHFEHDLAEAERIEAGRWEERPLMQRVRERAVDVIDEWI